MSKYDDPSAKKTDDASMMLFPSHYSGSRSKAFLAWLLLFCSLIRWSEAQRAARPMSRDFFVQILFTAAETGFDDSTPSTNPLDDWDIQTEWNWQYANETEQELGKPFPFILCDDDNATTYLERREAIAQQSNNTLDDMVTVYTTPDVTCVVALVGYSIAQGLGDFIVQPIGFIMKINSGSLDFVSDETKARQYAIQICPGLPWLNLTEFVLDTIDLVIPMIDFLLTVPEVEPFGPDLLNLQGQLEQDDTFCDDVLVNYLDAEQADVDYVILSLNTPEEADAPEACFLLLALGLAHSPEICFIERQQPFDVSNTVAQWIVQSGVPDERPFFDAGIDGKGQVVAVSDTGLDLDNCYFRDSVEELEIGGVSAQIPRRNHVMHTSLRLYLHIYYCHTHY